MTRADRGQLVLVAAAVAALALVPVVLAYLQFGYAPAVADVDGGETERVDRSLDRVVDEGAEVATGEEWADREASVADAERAVAPQLDALETSRLRDGVAVNVTYDERLASQVPCPRGDGRSFGNCESVGGVVVQERDGETVVVAAAFRVRVTTPEGTAEFGRVVRPR